MARGPGVRPGPVTGALPGGAGDAAAVEARAAGGTSGNPGSLDAFLTASSQSVMNWMSGPKRESVEMDILLMFSQAGLAQTEAHMEQPLLMPKREARKP